MNAALISAGTSTSSSFPFTGLLVLIVLVPIGLLLLRKLRRSASEYRKRRWTEAGLMDPTAAGPETRDSSE